MGRSEATTDTTTSTLTNIDTTKRRILVVEDEEALAVGIRDAIEHAGSLLPVVSTRGLDEGDGTTERHAVAGHQLLAQIFQLARQCASPRRIR